MRELQAALPHEKPRPLFRTLLSWGRYAEIISLDQRRHVIRLYEAKGTRSKPPAPAAPKSPPTDLPPPSDLPPLAARPEAKAEPVSAPEAEPGAELPKS